MAKQAVIEQACTSGNTKYIKLCYPKYMYVAMNINIMYSI